MSWGVIDIGTGDVLKQACRGGPDIPKNIFTSGPPDYFERVLPQMDRYGLENAVPALNQVLGELLHEIHEASLIALEDAMVVASPVTIAEELEAIDGVSAKPRGYVVESLDYHSTLSPERLIAVIKEHIMKVMQALVDNLPAERRDGIMARLDEHKKRPDEAIAAATAKTICLNPNPDHGFAAVDFLGNDEKLLVHSVAGPSIKDVNLFIGSFADSVMWRSKLSYPSLRSDMAAATEILVANRRAADIRDIIERVGRAKKSDPNARQYEDLVIIPLAVPEIETTGFRYSARYSTLHPEDLIKKVRSDMEWHVIALALATAKIGQASPTPPSSPPPGQENPAESLEAAV